MIGKSWLVQSHELRPTIVKEISVENFPKSFFADSRSGDHSYCHLLDVFRARPPTRRIASRRAWTFAKCSFPTSTGPALVYLGLPV